MPRHARTDTHPRMAGLLLILSLLLTAGCSDSAGSQDNLLTGPGSLAPACSRACGEGQYCSGGACVDVEADCDTVGFTSTNQAAFARFGGGLTKVRYVASNVEVEVDNVNADPNTARPPFDKIQLEITLERFFEGTPAPGSWDMSGMDTENRDSALFLRGRTFCNDYDCAFTYIVESGAIELVETGQPGGVLSGYLRNLKLKQVRIDTNSGAIIPFPTGKTWCVGDYAFSRDVPELSQAQGNCVEEGTGSNIGDNIRNFTLQNCLGDMIDLHTRCGLNKAVWLVATAGWCGACEAFVPQAAVRYGELADQGLDLMVVIGETAARTPPSLEYCMDYALRHGVPPENTFIDNDGGRTWPVTFDAINTYSGGSIGLPWNAVMHGPSMEYVWSSNAGSGDLWSVQQELLDRPE